MANCGYRILKNGTNYGIAINVTDSTASTWGDFGNYNLYVNGTANITSNLSVGGTISGGSFTPTNPLAIEYGGTGSTTAANAWTALGGGASGKHADSYFALASHEHSAGDITSGTLPIARGGTNATTAANARTQLGITPANIGAKATQTAVNDPAYDGDSLTFINTISQNAQGVITPHKAAVRSASTTQNGIVTIGEQTFAGLKTFTNSIDIQTAYGYLRWKKSIGNNDISALISANNATTTAPARFWFYQYILDSSGNHITNNVYERFSLPAVTTTRTASKDFNILTDKSAVTIAQGGTGETTATAAANAFLGGLPIWTATALDTTYFIRQDTSGTENFGRVQASTLFDYMKGKFGTAATHAHGDYVTIADAQTITGIKTFAEPRVSNGWIYWYNSFTNSVGAGILMNNNNSSSTNHQLYFRQYSYNTDGTRTAYYDYFKLPSVAVAKSTNDTYDILTTKSAVTIAQGGTGKTTATEAWTALGGGASGKHADSYFALASHNHAAGDITSGTLSVARGGTGASIAEKGTVTYATNSFTNGVGALKVYRVGKMGIFIATGQTVNTHGESGYKKVATINEGWRPKEDVSQRIPLLNYNWIFRITASGEVQFSKTTDDNTTFYTTMVFPLAD